MKFTINGKLLKTELETALRVIEKRSTIPVLENVLVSAENGILTLTGTDLDNFMICPVAVHVDTPGRTCVSAKSLSDLTKTLADDIAFEIIDNRLELNCGTIKVRLPMTDADQFPNIPEITAKPQIVITGEHLRAMVKDTLFCITKENSRFTLAGAKLEANKKAVKFITTDGHRLAYTAIKSGFQCDGKVDTLISKKSLTEAAKLSNCTVSITDDGKQHIRFMSGGRTLISRKLTGKFPNYEMVMPKDNDRFATFDIVVLKDAVKRAAVAADERNKSIRITFSNSQAVLESQSSGSAVRSETIPVEYTGEETMLGFNHVYLSEYLNLAKSGTGKLAFKGANNQVEFTIDGYEYDYKFVIMPLKV